ncbi:MAG: hypothetical protein KAS48_09985, partial [Gammaproteobacteria bacterium]|nr:hypothetical protein [Gammaproteobacteria bacterium]
LVIGAPSTTAQGVVLVYDYVNGLWQVPQALVKPTIDTSDLFGRALAIDGDTILVGAEYRDSERPTSGSVHAFVLGAEGQWMHQQQIVEVGPVADEQFGSSLALQGDTAIVGAPFGLTPVEQFVSGAVYIFQRTGNVWNQQDKIVSSDIAPNDEFASTVAMYGTRMVVGSPKSDRLSGAVLNDSGAVYVFRIETYSEHKLTAYDQAIGDQFGYSVRVGGDTLVVAAADVDLNGWSSTGAVYIYTRQDKEWLFQQKLLPDSADVTGDFFQYGTKLDIDGDVLAVASSAGPVYVYKRNGSIWLPDGKLTAPVDAFNSVLGRAVSVRANTIAIGTSGNGTNANNDASTAANDGMVTLYEKVGTSWELVRQLEGDPLAGQGFGNEIALNDDATWLGVAHDGQSFVKTYQKVAGDWIYQGDAGEVANSDRNVSQIAFAGDSLVLALDKADHPITGIIDSGLLTVWTYNQGISQWESSAELVANDASVDAWLGYSIDASGSRIIAAAPRAKTGINNDLIGVAYSFMSDPDLGWIQVARYSA